MSAVLTTATSAGSSDRGKKGQGKGGGEPLMNQDANSFPRGKKEKKKAGKSGGMRRPTALEQLHQDIHVPLHPSGLLLGHSNDGFVSFNSGLVERGKEVRGGGEESGLLGIK
jgi:hypothetical protein